MEHDGGGRAVGEHVGQFGRDVLVVEVHRRRTQLQRGEEGLDVLGPVGERDGDRVTRADAVRGEHVGQPVGPAIELAEGDAAVAADDGLAVGNLAGHRLPRGGVVPSVHGGDTLTTTRPVATGAPFASRTSTATEQRLRPRAVHVASATRWPRAGPV